MNPADIFPIIPLVAAAGYGALILAAYLRPERQKSLSQWAIPFLLLSIVWELLILLPPAAGLITLLPIKAILISTTILGAITWAHANWQRPRLWLYAAAAGLILTLAVDLLLPEKTVALTRSGSPKISYSNLVSHALWLGMSGFLLGRVWLDFRRTRFPWHSNRLLFWLIAMLLTLGGEALLFFSWTGLNVIGQALRLVGVSGLIYAISSYRIPDVRTRYQAALAAVIITFVSGTPLAAAILLVQWLARSEPAATAIILSLAAMLLAFLAYQPLRKLIARMVYRYLLGEGVNTGAVVRRYSRAVYKTLDVEQLSQVVKGTLGEILNVDRSALLLATPTSAGLTIEPAPRTGDASLPTFEFPDDSLFLRTLVEDHQPLLQYDLDFSPDFGQLSEPERSWLEEAAMDVFIPVGTDTELVGMIAIGPRSSGIPYQPWELELAQILADQTVVALQNSRLYSELTSQNNQIRQLNVDLLGQNDRLAVMDKVKSDFIAIASHELRTPLTQIIGYADILDSMNSDGSIDVNQTREIVTYINRATALLDAVISAMVDASEIDVEGIQLACTRTRLADVLVEAITPLQGAVRDRRISMIARGFDTLPTIYADHKRLVQSLGILLGNAIKYTPDHGAISITASQPIAEDGGNTFVEIVVADTGIGIDAEYHDLIFEKFFRVGEPQFHSTGSTKFKGAGPGLGLPIAKGVIEAHGGRIWVESDGEDEERLPGSRFHVVLPIQPPGMSLEPTLMAEGQAVFLSR